MIKTEACIWLSPGDRATLEEWVSGRNTPQKLVWRARIVLLSAERVGVMAITRAVGKSKVTVARWQERYLVQGINGRRRDATRPGRKPPLNAQTIEQVVHKTLHEQPPGSTHWSIRKMAAVSGLSRSSIQRIWQAHQLKPHRVKTFKLSNDKHFAEKVQDIIGLYLNPPDKALVFAVDEKSQIQALARPQPGLPLKKGRCGTMTHDYKRHGTTTLFAALDVLAGKVIGDCYKRHRYQEFLKFLRRINREFPGKMPLHLVMDNYGTHGTPEVKAWLKRNPRFKVHCVPTSSSWLNLIERWFGELTSKRIRRDSFLSVEDLIAAINEFLVAWNESLKPFVSTGTVEAAVTKLARCRQTLEQIQPGCTARKRPNERPANSGTLH